MNISGITWVNNAHKIISRMDLYVEESYFEDFLFDDCSACLSLESKGRIDITRSSFKDIVNLQKYSSTTNHNAAAIYSALDTATNVFIDRTCFLECSSSHGHSFGCYGTMQASFNTSVIITQRVNEAHPSFLSTFKQSNVYEINFTKTNQEMLYLNNIPVSNIRFISFVDVDLSSLRADFKSIILAVPLTSSSNIAVKNITDMISVIQAQEGNVVNSLFLDSIGDAIISSQSIIVNILSYTNGNSIKLGSATVENTKQVSSPEVCFRRPAADCFLGRAKHSAEQQQLRIAAAVVASLLLDRAIQY